MLATYLANLDVELVTLPTPGRLPRPATTLAAAVDDQTAVRGRAAPELLRLPGRGRGARRRSRTTPGRCSSSAFDPISLGLLKRPGDYGADIAVAEGQSLGTPMALRRAVPGHPGLPRGVRPQDARPARRPDDRPPRQALLGADAADARAAHPPREGDEQHLHEPGAVRPAGRGVPGALGPQGLREDGRAVPAEGPLRGQPVDGRRALALAFDRPTFKEFVVRDTAGGVERPA